MYTQMSRRRNRGLFSDLASVCSVACWCLWGTPPSVHAGPRLDEVSFIAVHNAYKEAQPPSTQIRDYNVWEVEVDFGQDHPGAPLEVGHWWAGNDTPNHGFGHNLKDWLQNIRDGAAGIRHPVLIKLEANTSCRAWYCACNAFSHTWCWPEVSLWDSNWLDLLRTDLADGLGEQNIYRPRDFYDTDDGEWPPVEAIAGKFIISLQTRHVNDDHALLPLKYSTEFEAKRNTPVFVRLHDAENTFPDERPSFPLLKEGTGNGCPNDSSRTPCPTGFTESFQCGVTCNANCPRAVFRALRSWVDDSGIRRWFNRLIMDCAFNYEWAHVGTHPPVPLHVKPASTMRWGTSAFPHNRVGQALAAGWVIPVLPSGPLDGGAYEGRPSYIELAIQAGTYPERITFSRSATLTAAGGPVTIGGNQVAYTVHVQVPESPSDAWTDGAVSVTVNGDNGSFACSFSGGEGRENGFVNPGVRRCFAVTNGDVGVIRSAHIANPAHEGYFDCIYVDSGTTGRYYIPVHEWVNPTVTKLVAAHWD